jgi:hypothetical protein
MNKRVGKTGNYFAKVRNYEYMNIVIASSAKLAVVLSNSHMCYETASAFTPKIEAQTRYKKVLKL